jgi:uroporphyrinogen-III synthase
MSRTTSQPLGGRSIVITRPVAQAQQLAELVREAGGNAILFPAIEILDAADPKPLNDIIARLDEFDIAIFISPSAVAKAMALITARRALPAHLKCVTIGSGSLKALESFGVREIIAPKGRYDSEALLALPLFQNAAGKQVVVFRGDGGREFLGDELTKRGAHLEYATCYRRSKPSADPAPLLSAWSRNEIAALVFTSSEGLRNFHEIIGAPGQPRLCETPVFVPHPRIAVAARGLGLTKVIESGSGDEALVAALVQRFGAA